MTLWHHGTPLVQWGAVIGASLAAAVCDVRSGRIPNLLTGPALLAGLTWAVWTGGLGGLADAAAGCTMLAAPYVLLFVFVGGGAGDAKLMGAVGAWLGVVNGMVALCSVLFAGVVLAVGSALAKKRLGSLLANLARIAAVLVSFLTVHGRPSGTLGLPMGGQESQTIPYGVAICAGICIAAGGVFAWRAW